MHLGRPETTAAGRSQSEDAGDKSSGCKWDIEPVLDRLVLFRSDLVDHEVSQAIRERGVILVAEAGCYAMYVLVRSSGFSPSVQRFLVSSPFHANLKLCSEGPARPRLLRTDIRLLQV